MYNTKWTWKTKTITCFWKYIIILIFKEDKKWIVISKIFFYFLRKQNLNKYLNQRKSNFKKLKKIIVYLIKYHLKIKLVNIPEGENSLWTDDMFIFMIMIN